MILINTHIHTHTHAYTGQHHMIMGIDYAYGNVDGPSRSATFTGLIETSAATLCQLSSTTARH